MAKVRTSLLRSDIGGSGGLGKGGRGQDYEETSILRDNIQGVTKGDIRRLARRGGVKRISGLIYDDVRTALRQYLDRVLGDVAAIVQLRAAKTVTTSDVVFCLARQGKTLYGFGEAQR